MALFDLLSREELNTSFEEIGEPKPIHPSVPESIEENNEDQVKLLSNVLNTIDSLESLKHTLLLGKENNYQFSNEECSAMTLRVSLAYESNNLVEQLPLHLSTEEFSSVFGKNTITLALEEIDYRIATLSTEADNIFRRIWEGMKDVFGNELNRVENLKAALDRSIERLSQSQDTTKRTVAVKSGSALEIGGKVNLKQVIGNLVEVNKQYIQDGNIFRIYQNQLEKFSQFVTSNAFTDKATATKKILAANFFTLGKPFVRVNENTKQRYYQIPISDLNKINVSLPTGVDKLYPKARENFDEDNVSPLRNKIKKGNTATLTTSKDEILTYLKELRASLEQVPKAREMESITREFRNAVKDMCKREIPLKAAQKEIKKWDSVDTSRVVGSIVIGIPFLALGGGLALCYWAAGTVGAAIGVGINAAVGNNSIDRDRVAEANHSEHNKDIAFIQGAALGPAFSGFMYLNKKAIYGLETKLTLFFVDFYRAYYSALASTGRALINAANELE